MRINQDNIINNSPDVSFLLVQEEDSFSGLMDGDIITGTIAQNGASPLIRFDQLAKEIPADPENYRYSAIGEKHAFRVEKTGNKVTLKDIGIFKENEALTAPAMTDPRDSSLLRMTHDFRETMNDIESEETKAASDINEEDAANIISEGFDIEDFKAERLVRALERIHTGRESKKEDITNQINALKEEKRMIKKQSARTVADRYDSTLQMADRLFGDTVSTSDLYTSHVSNTSPSAAAASGTHPLVPEDGKAVSKESLTKPVEENPSILYTSPTTPSDSGTSPIVPEDGKDVLTTPVTTDGTEAASTPVTTDGTEAASMPVTTDGTESSSTPISALDENSPNPTDTYKQIGTSAVDNKNIPEDLPSPVTSTWREITFRIHIEEQRLRMAGFSSKAANSLGTGSDILSIENTVKNLRDQLRTFMEDLSREWDIDAGYTSSFFTHEETSLIAVDTLVTAADISDAPVSFYRSATRLGTSVTFESLGDSVSAEETVSTTSAVTLSVIASYDRGATEIRSDLGDSLKKAFDHIDEVLTENNLPVTDANKRAVRILASANLPVTEESINEVKYYDAKVMSVVDRMTPAAVLSLIKRGINPLKESIDSLEELLDEAPEKSPLSREEQISTFLVNLDEKGDISEAERTAYINIYRLLYTISRDDYAAIATVLADGREMSLKNLLTAQRSRRDSGMDVKIDDTTSVVQSDTINSISANLEAAFAYNKRLTNEILSETDPDVTDRALADSVPDNRYEELTIEEVALRIRREKDGDTAADPARARELIRFCMSSSPEYRRFLKKIGLKDSVKNTTTLIEGLNGDTLGIPAGSVSSLTDAMEGKETLDAYASELLTSAEEAAKDSIFPAEQTNAESPTGVLSALSRYDLLRDLTKKEHYRFTLDNGTGSNINLTFIHDRTNAGTVNIQISDETLMTSASLTVRNTPQNNETRAVIYGSITCESIEETRSAEGLLRIYNGQMRQKGIDAGGITIRSGGLGILQTLSDLTGIIPTDYSPPETTGSPVSSETLYDAAKSFVEIWTSARHKS
ncbi:MAG: DUF6240 domain-containing protein [Lachnospiraceae bacterium]|nr:DUF6240 domain-containing protein [Lachnospiraceae bacterium]